MPEAKILLAGIGSLRGDDQAGWLVAGQLAEELRDMENIDVRLATVPLDMVDWMDGIRQLHIVDACQSENPAGTVHRINWNNQSGRRTSPVRFSGNNTHDYGVTDVLLLAETSEQLPDEVILWAIDGKKFELSSDMDPEVRAGVGKAVHQILAELKPTDH